MADGQLSFDDLGWNINFIKENADNIDKDKNTESLSDDELSVFRKDGWKLFSDKPVVFPTSTRWIKVELLLKDANGYLTCTGKYKDLTFCRNQFFNATLVGWR